MHCYPTPTTVSFDLIARLCARPAAIAIASLNPVGTFTWPLCSWHPSRPDAVRLERQTVSAGARRDGHDVAQARRDHRLSEELLPPGDDRAVVF